MRQDGMQGTGSGVLDDNGRELMKLTRRDAFALVTAAALGTMATAADAKTLLRMNHQMAANTAGSIVDQWFAEEVKKRTNGAVEMKVFFSNGLGEVKETLSL